MRRKILLLLASVTFATAPLAMGQAYTGTVLFQITTPSGFAGFSSGPGSIDGSGFAYSSQVIGFGYQSNVENNPNSIVGDHAFLLTASGAVDLNPTTLTGFPYSQANGTRGTQ